MSDEKLDCPLEGERAGRVLLGTHRNGEAQMDLSSPWRLEPHEGLVIELGD